MKYKLLLFSCLWLTFSFSQDHSNANTLQSILDDDLTKTERINALKNYIKQSNDSVTTNLGNAYHELGKSYYRTKQYDKAIEATKQAIIIREQLESSIKEINNSRFNLYRLYEITDQYQKSLSVKKDIVKTNNFDKYFNKACISLAKISEKNNDFYNALQFLKRGIASHSTHRDKNSIRQTYERYISASFGMDSLSNKELLLINKYADSLEYLPYKLIGNRIKTFLSLTTIYEKHRQYDKAEHYYSKAENLILKMPKIDSSLIYTLKINKGSFYSFLGKTDEADKLYNEALAYSKNQPEEQALIYDNIAYYMEDYKVEEKLQLYHKALCLLTGNTGKVDSLLFLPGLNDLEQVKDKNVILTVLIDKTETWLKLYHKTQEKKHLEEAIKTAQLSDEIISFIRNNSIAERSKLLWVRKGINLYNLAIEASYLLNDIEQQYYFMEKNKALVLLERLSFSKYRNQLDLDVEYFDIIDEDYKAYSDKLRITPLSKVQETLDANTAIIEYAKGNESFYGLYITTDSIHSFTISNKEQSLIKKLISYNVLVSKPFETIEERQQFFELSYELYNTLIPIQTPKKRLMIIPDGELRTLAFDALVISNTAKPIYVIEQHELFYEYSFSSLQAINSRALGFNDKFLTINPKTYSNNRYTPLHRSSKTVEDINNIFSGDALNENASKSNFTEQIDAYDIIHLNTHAGYNVEGNESWIAFKDDDISLSEVYELKNNASLVSLAACETALGEQIQGEGVMSLSRAFFYSGAKSVVSTLWKANEKTTNTIYYNFYKNLKQGNTKSKALQDAKINYLETHQLGELSPYYWSGLVLTGNTDALYSNSENKIWLYIILGLTFALLLLFIRFSKRRAKLKG